MKNAFKFDAVTVTLNPAIDRTVTIPEFSAGAVNRVEQVRSNPGGKGVNVASALADFGLRAAATGFLGRDNTASFEGMFREKGIADHFVRIAGQTRVGIKIADPVLHQTTDINFPGPTPSASDIDSVREQIAALDGEWFVLAGSLPPGVDAGIYGELTAMIKARGAKVALDTSGEALGAAIDAGPDIIKPNINELEALLGGFIDDEAAIIAAARGFVARGVGLVAVSMGRDGACLVTANEVVIARPPDIEVKSTVGAGDAMVAGMVAGRLRNLSLADCARMGTAFSLEALRRIESGIRSASSIADSMKRVSIREPAEAMNR